MSKERGFSIIEVLLGITIFMIGMLGVALLHISSMKNDDFSGRMAEATSLATAKLEELSGLPFTNTEWADTDGDAAAGLDDTAADMDNSEPVTLGSRTYTVVWNVAVNTPIINSNTVRVYVLWVIKGISHSIRLTRIQSKEA